MENILWFTSFVGDRIVGDQNVGVESVGAKSVGEKKLTKNSPTKLAPTPQMKKRETDEWVDGQLYGQTDATKCIIFLLHGQ